LGKNARELIECLKRRASKCLLSVFVPKSMFEAEEKNAEGFAKECAIVTHYRLKMIQINPES
jgi:prolyl-tRNA synthetase